MNCVFSILIILTFCRFGQTDFCQYNFSVSDLDRSAVLEIISFINGYAPEPYKAIDENNINFWLYTRSSPSGNRLNSNTPEVKVKKTILLIPGWLCNITNDLMPELKHAYLTRYDANVIIVDWSYYAAKTYGEAFRYIPSIGETIAKFLMTLDKNLGISINSIHLVGHSMGAQVSGFTGQSLINKYGKRLYRITGLDPAGPIYSTKFSNERLDESDAVFVDIIHVNAGILGYSLRCGDIDFYPNCGTFQSGCEFSLNQVTFVDFIIHKIGCDHLRSVDYMIESINYKNFKSRRGVLQNELVCFADSSDISYMGEDSVLMHTNGKYILFTNPSSPYSQG